MQSETDIVNSALIELGQDTIASLDGSSKAARLSKRQYPIHRDRMIQRYRWTCCIRRVILAPESAAPEFGFTYKSLLPSDAIEFIGIYDENEPQQNYTSSRIPYKVEGRFVLSDEEALPVFYKVKITDPTQFDPLLAGAISFDLAVTLCRPLTGGVQLQAHLKSERDKIVKEAKLSNAIQTMPELIQASEWLDARATPYPHRMGPVV